jgi:hypothetical protein
MTRKYRASSRYVITDVELLTRLSPYSLTTQSAIMLLLIGDIEPPSIKSLTWQTAKAISLSGKSIRLINALPRHLFSNLVFWNLSNFDEDLMRFLNDTSIDHQRSLYSNMIYTLSSYNHFMSELNDHIFWNA